MLKYFRLLVIYLLASTSVYTKEKPPKLEEIVKPLRVVFISYDIGEARDLLRMRKMLLAKYPHAQVTFLSFGPCGDLLMQENPQPYISLCSILPVEIHNTQDDSEVRRAIKYDPELVKQIVSENQANFVFTGMSSRIQEQLSRQYRQSGAKVITYYDSFDKPISESQLIKAYAKPYLKFIPAVDTVMVMATALQNAFKDHKTIASTPIYVVGKPSLAYWQEYYSQVRSEKLRRKYNIKAKKIVLFAGSYGETYSEAFQIFVEAAKQMPSVQFLVTYHPNSPTKGDLERRIIENHGAENIQVIEQEPNITISLSKIADVFMAHKSSIGAAALTVGLPVIFVAKADYTNFVIEQKFADRVFTESDILRILRAKLLRGRSEGSRIVKQVPTNGFQSFLNLYSELKPYKLKPKKNITKKNSTVKKSNNLK